MKLQTKKVEYFGILGQSTILMRFYNIKTMRKQEQQQPNNEQDVENQEGGVQYGSEDEDGEQGDSKWKKIEKPEKSINLFMIDFNQCDGKKCTGRKMERFQMLKSIKDKERKKKFKGVVLSAFGDKPISIEDLQLCIKHGLCVIDCSWNRIEETNQFRFKNERILPYVVAGNPVNYGKPFQLSCVEALATALCAINYVPQAEYIMSKFGWADGFWSINSKIIEYGHCKSYQELEILSQQIEQSENTMKQNYVSDQSDNSSDNDSQSDSDHEIVEKQKQAPKQQSCKMVQIDPKIIHQKGEENGVTEQ